ncbi:hypothetical protein DFH27DRAFT_538158 [Peziza echinospora]|nr:hypothetical protein DFH27DRAFT_538158 [Peziza echinospora]
MSKRKPLRGKGEDFDFEFGGAKQWLNYAQKNAEAAESGPPSRREEEAQVQDTPNSGYLVPLDEPSTDLGPRPVPQVQQPRATAQASQSNRSQHSTFPVEPNSAPAEGFQRVRRRTVPDISGPSHAAQYVASTSNGLPSIREMDRRRGFGYFPEELILDNEATRRMKSGAEADDTYNFSMFFPNGFKAKFYGNREINLRYISWKTNTWVAPSAEDIHIVDMWGTEKDIEEAKEDLYALGKISLQSLSQGVSRAREKFGKNKAAPTAIEAERIQKYQALDQKQAYFKTLPEDTSTFPVVGVFSWPVNDINPQTALGKGLEALDPIRMDHECHIDFNRADEAIYVYGMKPVDVQTALDRIFGALCEIATMNRCLGPTTTRFHITVPPSSEVVKSHVKLDQDHNLVGRQITVKLNNIGVQCTLNGLKPTANSLREWEEDRIRIIKANAVFFRKIVQRGLEDTLFLRTQVHMKVNFGKLVLFGYQKQSSPDGHDLKKFLAMMRDNHVQSEMIRYIGPDSVARELIHTCRLREDIFHPLHMVGPTVEGRPERLYSATFELKLTDGTISTAMRLECDFGPEEIIGGKRLHLATSNCWLNIPRHGRQYKSQNDNEGAYKRKGPLDVKVLDLGKDMAWQLEISSYSRLKEAEQYSTLMGFVSHLRLETPTPTAADRGTEPRPVMNFINLHDGATQMTVESVVVKSKYQWFISTTPYIFEVIRYDQYAFLGVEQTPQGVAASVRDKIPDSRWGASLTSRDWTDSMGSQWNLPFGRPGRWKYDVAEFFKPTNVGGIDDPFIDGRPAPRPEWEKDGFLEFQGRIEECLELIVRAQKDAKRREEIVMMGVHEDDMD